ncbi:hypothetical protein L227DRAFT_159468 [Lentinus tigrinus ALCF2SS1-6]|uniref:Uncharacterized protein n=1 Tax=Lentinus tigrinus ALCF2SS1-6 TaxID=1328759 RepID=A0A5C2S6C5_9APHY|nr:hypothetical protein L227DRAFT_159468 [Lentinus tigrinus ALCF2SS1-6]
MPASAHLGIRALSCLRFILSRHHHHRFIACTQPRTYSTQVVHLICSPSIILLALRTSPPPGAMVQAITATTPRVSPLLVCGACDAPPPVKLSTPRTFLSTIFFGGHRSTSQPSSGQQPPSSRPHVSLEPTAETRDQIEYCRVVDVPTPFSAGVHHAFAHTQVRSAILVLFSLSLSVVRLFSSLHLGLSEISPVRGIFYDCDCYMDMVSTLEYIVLPLRTRL